MKISRRVVAIALAACCVAPAASAAGACDSLGPCAARACRLDAQIAQAKDKGQTREVAALERQRADMVHCSDDGLKQKRKMALDQAQARIDKREAELKKVQATGDAKKIGKAQRNLENAHKTYAEIERAPL